MQTTGERRAGEVLDAKGAPPSPMRVGFFRDLIAALALAFIAFLIGCLWNASRAEPLPWKYRSREEILSASVAHLQEASASPAGTSGSFETAQEVRLEEFQLFVEQQAGLVIDARPATFYRAAHVPGALSLPRETFAEDYPRVRAKLDGYKDRSIVLYCSGADCPDSQLMADALAKLGYRKLLIYTSGWEEWSQTGLPQESVAPTP